MACPLSPRPIYPRPATGYVELNNHHLWDGGQGFECVQVSEVVVHTKAKKVL